MQYRGFGKNSSKKKGNPFLNKGLNWRPIKNFEEEKPVKEVKPEPSTAGVVRSLDDMERVMRHQISKMMPSQIKANVARMYPDKEDIREVITHLQFPSDKKLHQVTEKKIETGLKKGYLCTSDDLLNSLGHLFCEHTIHCYYSMTNPTGMRTSYHLPKPIIYKKSRYFVKQDVAFYVQYVEELRAEGIAKRKMGYLVPQKQREQQDLTEITKKKNVLKFKVAVGKVFSTTYNFFAKSKA